MTERMSAKQTNRIIAKQARALKAVNIARAKAAGVAVGDKSENDRPANPAKDRLSSRAQRKVWAERWKKRPAAKPVSGGLAGLGKRHS
jgi:hypothetical protein